MVAVVAGAHSAAASVVVAARQQGKGIWGMEGMFRRGVGRCQNNEKHAFSSVAKINHNK